MNSLTVLVNLAIRRAEATSPLAARIMRGSVDEYNRRMDTINSKRPNPNAQSSP